MCSALLDNTASDHTKIIVSSSVLIKMLVHKNMICEVQGPVTNKGHSFIHHCFVVVDRRTDEGELYLWTSNKDNSAAFHALRSFMQNSFH